MRSKMASASAHSPAGSVLPPPATSVPTASSAPPLVLTVHSFAPVVSSPTIPAGITSGMPLLYCVSHALGTIDHAMAGFGGGRLVLLGLF